MNCPNCGKPNADNARFCAGCGAPLSAAGSPPPAAPAPAQRLDLPEGQVTASGASASGIPYEIIGTTLQAAVLTLQPGQVVYSEAGAMSWMDYNVNMEATTGGGLGKMLGRLFTGESLFVVDYAAAGGAGRVAFSNDFPGKILPIQLGPG